MNKKRELVENVQARRSFMIRSAEALAAAGLMPLWAKAVFAADSAPKPRVCLIQTKGLPKPGDDVRDILGGMLDEAIRFVSGKEDAAVFWKETFSPKEKVAVKLSAVIDRNINFGPQISQVVTARLVAAGLKAENITFYESDSKSLKRAGYTINIDGPGARYYGTNEVGYSDKVVESGKFSGCFSKILENSDALINIPLLKTHTLSGVSIAMKNHYGSFDHPNLYHANACNPFVADVNAAAPVKKKHRLVICDAMRVLYASGPQYAPEYTENYNGLLVGIDPVAVDAAGTVILRKLRKNSGKKLPLYTDPTYIKSAGKIGLGEADFGKIDFKAITV